MKLPFGVLLLLGTTAPLAMADEGPASIHIGIRDAGSTLGLTFTPPDEPGWETHKQGLNVRLARNAGDASDNRLIEAYLTSLDTPVTPMDDYLRTIERNIQQGYAQSQHASISALQVTADAVNPHCARVHLLLESRKPAADGQRSWSEQYARSCGSQMKNGMGYELRYYHRYTDAHRDPNLQAKAEQVLGSMRIEED